MTGIFGKLFGRRKPEEEAVEDLADTAPTKVEEKTDIGYSLEVKTRPAPLKEETSPPLELPQFIVGVGQSVGKQRDHNEDSLFTLATNLVVDNIRTPVGLFVIADGMGGHQHGEVASGISVRAVADHVIEKLYLPLLGITGTPGEESMQEVMHTAVMRAHSGILREALGGGTTLTAVFLLGDQMTITHVGDSRAYIFDKDGKVQVITHDHSLVKRLEELGQITAEEAAIHPNRNVLYRALGQGEPFEPDVATFPIPRSGHILLCSDGLWGVISEDQLCALVNSAPNPPAACQSLVDAANAAGGPDNISVILVKMPD